MNPPSKLCLNMIVKNEAPRMKRCLDSVCAHISAYAILDTGSTDGTPEFIREYFEAKGIPGRVEHEEFRDFSQARNAALGFAHRLLREANSSIPPIPEFTHVLLCDADMQFCADNDGRKDEYNVLKVLPPSSPGFMIPQLMGNIRYHNVRIVRADLLATTPGKPGLPAIRYIGATHEYLNLPVHALPKLDMLHFHDWADGASHAEKHERDKRLLLADLERDPNNVRALYYLGQTCSDLKEHAEALRWFERRAVAGGFEEEAWFAHWRSAQCYAELGQEGKAIETALAAYERRPHRLEPIHWLAKRFREKGKNHTAMLFTDAGLKKTPATPGGDLLFVDQEAHGHGFKYELSISGFYTGRPEEAKAACFAFIIDPDVPQHAREQARYNSAHYAPKAAELFAGSELIALVQGSDEKGYAPSNPSILKDAGRLLLNVRRVNYRINSEGQYVYADPTEVPAVIRTQNQWGWYHDDPIKSTGPHTTLRDDAGSPTENIPHRPGYGPVTGYEDVRLIGWLTADRMLASATVLDRNPNGAAEIALLQIVDDSPPRVVRADPMRGHEPEKMQKNWMPVVHAGVKRANAEEAKARPTAVTFLYSVAPWTLVNYDVVPNEAPRFVAVDNLATMYGLEHLRGSSQLVWVDRIEGGAGAGFYFVTHEVVHQGNKRTYLHRLAWVEALDRPDTLRLTDPFYFHTKGIEFCAGLAEKDGVLHTTFGLNDGEAWMCKVPVKAVWERLKRFGVTSRVT